MKDKTKLIVSGLIVGAIAVALVVFGNPANMGFCIACFIRDIAGSVGLHKAEVVQYMRPEIIGLVIGAFASAMIAKEFRPKGGSSPILRFVLGFSVMVGALMFLGCPLRMVLRISGGDLNAIIGLIGFICGILCGVFFLNRGFTLKKSNPLSKGEGFAITGINIALLIVLVALPSLLIFSESGPGSKHAAIIISLAAGLIVGILAQRTRLCMVGGIRDVVLFKDWTLLCGFIAILVAAFIGNAIFGFVNFGFAEQPIAHTDGIWNFLGMLLVGFGSVLLGGCPLRQLILSGEGNSDSAITVIGMLVGAAFCHNFGLASSANGPTTNGKVAVIVGILVVLAIAIVGSKKKKEAAEQVNPAETVSAVSEGGSN